MLCVSFAIHSSYRPKPVTGFNHYSLLIVHFLNEGTLNGPFSWLHFFFTKPGKKADAN